MVGPCKWEINQKRQIKVLTAKNAAQSTIFFSFLKVMQLAAKAAIQTFGIIVLLILLL